MATKKWFVVTSDTGLNVRERPTTNAKVLRVLAYNDRVEADWSVETVEGWLPLKDGGFVMRQFLK